MDARARGRAADAVVFTAFAAIPLASSAAFLDHYTTVKWYLLHALAAAWLLVEVWVCGSRGWPAFARAHRLLAAPFAALAAWSALRGGFAWGLAPLADRVACAILVLCAAWYFARNGGRTHAVVAGVAASGAVTIAVGLAQAWGVPLPAPLVGREGPAALFGNVNMAAQCAGLTLLAVLPAPAPGRAPERAWNAFRVALAAGGAVYLYVLSSRSVLIALAAAALSLAWTARRRAILAGAAAAAAVLVLAWAYPGARLDPTLAARKASSVQHRLALWADSVAMIRDRPLGAGAGGFEHAFLPYQAAGRLEPQEMLVFRSPHNEYLRFLAEDGIPFVLGGAALLGLLALRWRRVSETPPALRELVVGWAAFLAVEAAFQFPLALAFGALAASVMLGAAIAAVERPSRPGALRPWRLGATAASLALVAASLRVSTSERLFVASADDVDALRRACALDPRNLPACVTAAWLEARQGDAAAARERLGRVLAHAPSYPPAIKLLGDIALVEGDHAEACRRLSEYDRLFRGRSASHARARQACAAAR